MTNKTIPAVILGSSLMFAALTAQAACIEPFDPSGSALPPNDVSLDAFAFETASAAPFAIEVDMNGIQRGLEIQSPWATHGTLVLVADAAGNLEWVAGWTQNTTVDSVEWVCRFEYEPGALNAFGRGAYHSNTFGTGRVIERCVLDLVADCP